MTSVSRPALVLLPGMMLDGRSFTNMLPELSARADVMVADVGHGVTVEQIALQVLDRAPPRFAVVGVSMGGIIGFEIWRQAAHRVTHLALLGTTPHPEHAERSRERKTQLDAVNRGQLRDVLANSLAPRYLAGKNRTNESLLRSILDMGLTLGPDVFRRQSIALAARRDSREMLPTIDCPTLVLCGREDGLCSVAVHQEMAAAIPRADLLVLAECGHLSPLEEPAAVSHALQHLLSRTATNL